MLRFYGGDISAKVLWWGWYSSTRVLMLRDYGDGDSSAQILWVGIIVLRFYGGVEHPCDGERNEGLRVMTGERLEHLDEGDGELEVGVVADLHGEGHAEPGRDDLREPQLPRDRSAWRKPPSGPVEGGKGRGVKRGSLGSERHSGGAR